MAIIQGNITADTSVNFFPTTSAWRRSHVFYIDGDLDGASITVQAKDTSSGHGSALAEYVFSDVGSQVFEGQPQHGWDFVVTGAGAGTDFSIGWY